ncbi:MAG: cache domain-containing protein, partial [Deferrisomatales bacterium]
MKSKRWFSDLPIRFKLLLSYSAAFGLILAVGSAVIYSLVRRTIEANIESELKNSTAAIYNMVRTSADVAIRSHLRAVAEKNREIVEHFHGEQLRGRLSEAEARARATEVLLSQTIGKTGYVYCLDSRGVVRVHPMADLVGVDLSGHAFVREQAELKEGYQEYFWRNPGEDRSRPKAVYMAYFAPWDWVVSASAYREEFVDLIDVEDFRKGVLSLRFGQSGYAYVTDRQGTTVIHPKYQGMNIFDQEDVPAEFFRQMIERQSGKMTYLWKNPGEDAPREKVVLYHYLPEYEWMVASSSYLDEVYRPLQTARNIVFLAMAGSLALVLPLTFRISSSITSPLKDLRNRLA